MMYINRISTDFLLSILLLAGLICVHAWCGYVADPRVLRLDVSETQNADNAVKSAVELFGAVDMLVNNAGISQRGLYYDFPLDVDRRVMEVDFFGQIALTKALLPCKSCKRAGGFDFLVIDVSYVVEYLLLELP